jgi:hypothetical protein
MCFRFNHSKAAENYRGNRLCLPISFSQICCAGIIIRRVKDDILMNELKLDGKVIGDRYKIRGKISSGSYAEVFVARDLHNDGSRIKST